MKKKLFNINYTKLAAFFLQDANNSPLSQVRGVINDNEKYYEYIPIDARRLALILQDLESSGKTSGKFVDAGCGIPVIPALFNSLGFDAHGVEYTKLYAEFYKYYGEYPPVFHDDILKWDFSCYDVIYTYNPINDNKLMAKAINNITKTMKRGAVLYFVIANCDTSLINNFERFTKVGSASILKYKKP